MPVLMLPGHTVLTRMPRDSPRTAYFEPTYAPSPSMARTPLSEAMFTMLPPSGICLEAARSPRKVPVRDRRKRPRSRRTSVRYRRAFSDVVRQPVLAAGRARCFAGFDDGGCESLVEGAPEQLAAGRFACSSRLHRDLSTKRGEQVSGLVGASPTDQHGHVEPTAGHRRHDGDIGELDAGRLGALGQGLEQCGTTGVELL